MSRAQKTGAQWPDVNVTTTEPVGSLNMHQALFMAYDCFSVSSAFIHWDV